jgi:ATP-dependent DNA helicase RecG
LYDFIRKLASEGRQVYIVCPAVESAADEVETNTEYTPTDMLDTQDENAPLKSAVDFAAELSSDVFPEFTVSFIHGKMKGADKDAVMRRFVSGEINILVSTTVIEVGVNVPNAALMVVENAERFGLSQLHQLRGRVGRGAYKSYCMLVSGSKSKTAVDRLNVMRTTSDGYTIAKYDLDMRGPGDFFPKETGDARQHGAFKFKAADIKSDMSLLEAAASEAKTLLAADPSLERNPLLAEKLRERVDMTL